MPKFYVQSGRLRLVFDAEDAECAAIKAMQWSCDRRSSMEQDPAAQAASEPAVQEGDLADDILVSEQGFETNDPVTFDTLEVVAAWQALAIPWD
jgi:hypothetical protein